MSILPYSVRDPKVSLSKVYGFASLATTETLAADGDPIGKTSGATFTTEIESTSGLFVKQTGVGFKIIAPRNGVFRIYARVHMQAAGATFPYFAGYLKLRLNGTTNLATTALVDKGLFGGGDGFTAMTHNVEWSGQMSQGDYILITANVTAGSPTTPNVLGADSGNPWTSFSIQNVD